MRGSGPRDRGSNPFGSTKGELKNSPFYFTPILLIVQYPLGQNKLNRQLCWTAPSIETVLHC